VAKRVRGSRSSHRPGGQGPSRTKTDEASISDPALAPDASAGVDIDAAVGTVEAGYTELAIDESAVPATKTRRVRRTTKARSDSLSVRAAAEDAFVREDLRRIGVVSLVLVIGLAVAWLLFVAMDLLGLY
jgi:hypothetical protein